MDVFNFADGINLHALIQILNKSVELLGIIQANQF